MTRSTFHALHDGPGTFVIANAWDVITARVFENAGFPAIATSSAAVANSFGFADGRALPIDLHIATIARIAAALDVPLSADIENGYSEDPQGVGAFVEQLAQTGVAGYNLEDTAGPGTVYDLSSTQRRFRAAREAAPQLFLNARSDIFLERIGDEPTRIAACCERLKLFADEGADGVFVPGVSDPPTIARLVAATPLPLNLLVSAELPDAATLATLGVRRVSLGSWPMRRTLGLLRDIAADVRETGRFGFTSGSALSYAESNALVSP